MTRKKSNPIPKTVSGRDGGLKRARKLSRKRRHAIALAAGLARWEQVPAAARSEAGRKAVQARWAKAKQTKGKRSS